MNREYLLPDNRLLLTFISVSFMRTDEFTLIRAVDFLLVLLRLICFTLLIFGFRGITFFEEFKDISVLKNCLFVL